MLLLLDNDFLAIKNMLKAKSDKDKNKISIKKALSLVR